MSSAMRLADMTWTAIAEAVSAGFGVILPTGTVEQHGPHLPVSTDYMIATRLAEAAAGELRMLVAPTLAYGYRSRPLSGGGDGFVGTTPVSGQTYIAVVADILESLIEQGFRSIALVNWHFENQNFLYEAVHLAMRRSLSRELKVLLFEHGLGNNLTPSTKQMLFDGDFQGWALEHAAVYETSLMMHLCPELVDVSRVQDDSAPRRVWYDVFPTPDDTVPPSGVLWKATGSTSEKGELVWRELVAALVGAILTEIPSVAADPVTAASERTS